MDDAMRTRLKEALVENGEMLAKEMRNAAPQESGTLIQSIRVEPQLQKLNPRVYVKAGGPLTTKPVQRGRDGSFDYANAVEFGTRKMPARPFFYPTYRRLKLEIRGNIDTALRKVLDVDLKTGR